MPGHCSVIDGGGATKFVREISGDIEIQPRNGTHAENCEWRFSRFPREYNVMTVNVTNIQLDCNDESLKIAGDEYCGKTNPFCVRYSPEFCSDATYSEGCENRIIRSHADSIELNGVTAGHGFSLGYSFTRCGHQIGPSGGGMPGLHPFPEPDPEPSSNVARIVTPIVSLVFIFAVVTAFYFILRRRKKAREESLKFQQYISTVASNNNTQTTDVPSGSSLTLEFGRSYEAVPRGTSPSTSVPIYPVIQENPNTSSNSAKGYKPHETNHCVPTKDSAIRISHSPTSLTNEVKVKYTPKNGKRQSSDSMYDNPSYVSETGSNTFFFD